MHRALLLLVAPAALIGCTAPLNNNPTSVPSVASGDAAAAPSDTEAPQAPSYREDALSVGQLIDGTYAYLDRFESASAPISEKLRLEAEQVTDRRSLLRYVERALLTLSDHHAITGSSLAHSWAVVPSYADLWLIENDGLYTVDAVRSGSPAQEAEIGRGDRIVSVDGVPIGEAVSAFWADLGLPMTSERAAFAARVLAAGRRDRPRRIGLQRNGVPRSLELPSLYSTPREERAPITVLEQEDNLTIRINDALGEDATIAAFDAAMAGARAGQPVVIDLRDTPGGGNTTVARAILGWFVDRPRAYQVHNLPGEQRSTGVPRQWIEQVLPRAGKHHTGPVRVLVGRWTGSMGEGLAIGFDAIGADVTGGEMAGLLGAIYDHRLEHSGLIIKLPTERLMHVDGTPREQFVPDAADR
jgi:carboxyl-terminal processing protease